MKRASRGVGFSHGGVPVNTRSIASSIALETMPHVWHDVRNTSARRSAPVARDQVSADPRGASVRAAPFEGSSRWIVSRNGRTSPRNPVGATETVLPQSDEWGTQVPSGFPRQVERPQVRYLHIDHISIRLLSLWHALCGLSTCPGQLRVRRS